MHISLGVLRDAFPIGRFLNAGRRKTKSISTSGMRGVHAAGSLTFATNPQRRGGEWVIRDQFTHRHPAWSASGGFPKTYSAKNPPYILVFRVGRTFHVRFALANRLSKAPDLPGPILTDRKGIVPTTGGLLAYFRLNSKSTADKFRDEIGGRSSPSFDPKKVRDQRRRVLREVYRRQGQQAFRRKLVAAYGKRCVITRERSDWVLEAAHITPYRGSDTNAVSNGLLLRADIHTLFDLGLVSIDADTRRVKVSSVLVGTAYAKLSGKKLLEPKTHSARPSAAALREHFSGFDI